MRLSPSFDEFAKALGGGKPQVVWTKLVADLETPVSAFLKISGGEPMSFLFESVEGGETRGRYSVIGLRPDLVWRARRGKAKINRTALVDANAFRPDPAKPLDSLRALVAASRIEMPQGLPPMASGLFGYMGYDMVREIERLPDNNPDQLGVPDSIFIRPTVIAIFDNIEDSIAVATPVFPAPGLDARAAYAEAEKRLSQIWSALERPLSLPHAEAGAALPAPVPTSNTTREAYHAMVEKAKEYILAGDIFQVVPSQRFAVPFTLPPFALYRSLRRLNPSPYLFFLDFGGFSIIGSSPEILVRLRDGVVTIRPIAGTRRRGKDAAEDQALATELLADPKEIAEHLMLLDLGRNDVGRVAATGTVKVTEKMVIERYSHVMHIVSNVEGRIDPTHDALDALAGGFPAGTVSGAPKVRAMEIIDELEVARRGVYGGAVGYFAANGTMDTCIALRTAVVKDNTVYVQAGGGVVADSDPEAEYQESCNKARALIRAAEEAVAFAEESGRRKASGA
ncbi:MAG TPA: anthranilate synthase component I [Alphaproteobacteria bacterium]|nr:anthranilate synthase component I [Alphaproteobacteria bacterium]